MPLLSHLLLLCREDRGLQFEMRGFCFILYFKLEVLFKNLFKKYMLLVVQIDTLLLV